MKISYISWIPAVAVMVVIFLFSAETREESSAISGGLTYGIVNEVKELLSCDWNEAEMERIVRIIHTPIRKLGHITEYLVLAVCWSFHFIMLEKDGVWKRKSWEKAVSWKRVLLVTLLCFLYAASDELHQMFVPGRGPQIRDVLLDTSSAFLTAGFVFGLRLFRNHNRRTER